MTRDPPRNPKFIIHLCYLFSGGFCTNGNTITFKLNCIQIQHRKDTTAKSSNRLKRRPDWKMSQISRRDWKLGKKVHLIEFQQRWIQIKHNVCVEKSKVRCEKVRYTLLFKLKPQFNHARTEHGNGLLANARLTLRLRLHSELWRLLSQVRRRCCYLYKGEPISSRCLFILYLRNESRRDFEEEMNTLDSDCPETI